MSSWDEVLNVLGKVGGLVGAPLTVYTGWRAAQQVRRRAAEDAEQQQRAYSASLYDTGSAIIDQLRTEITRLAEKDTLNQERLDALEAKAIRQEDELRTLREDNARLRSRIRVLEQERARADTLENQLKTVHAENAALRTRVAELESEMAALRAAPPPTKRTRRNPAA